MQSRAKKISVVTVNYNGLGDTERLLVSLGRHLEQPYEIIVVDNGSEPEQASVLRARFPEAAVLRSDRNLGFAGGNNLGISHAEGDYILLLNNDAYVEDGTLRRLADRLDSSPAAGVVSPKIRFGFGDRHIQFAGYTPMSRITLRNGLIGFDTPDDGRYDTARRTPYAHGAAMMLKREVVEKAGPMPEDYFLYYEELDWCERIREAGYEIWYEPACTVFHNESRSTGRNSPLKIKYLTRNRLLYARRNRKGFVRAASMAYQLCAAAPKNAVSFLLRGQRAQSAAVIRGCAEFFKL